MDIENSKKLRLEVHDINKNILGILTDNTEYSVDNLQIDESINETTKINFRISNKNEKSKYLINENLVKLDNEYYIVKKPNFDTVEEEFQIECEHESLRLKEVLCGKISYIAETAESLITKILSGTGWVFGGTDIPTSKKRHLESDELSVFANLVEIANNFNARLKFSTDIVNGNEVKSVSLYSNPINNGRYIKNNRDLNGVNISYDSSEMVTRLYVYGRTDDGTGREINMMEAHPNKLPYVENFSYFKDLGYTDSEINAKKNQFVKELILRESSLYTPQEVYEFALEEIARLCYPKVEASVEILDLSCDDKFMKTPIQIGEIINVIDTNTGLILSANVVSISRDYENPLDVSIGISNVIEKNSTLKRMSQSTNIVEKIIDSGTEKIHGTYIKEATIGSAHLGQAIIQNAHIADGIIDRAKIDVADIREAVVGEIIVGSANIKEAAIQEAHIQDASITSAKIVDASITNAKIVDLDATKVSFDTGEGNVLELQTLLSNFISGNSGQFLNLTGDNIIIANGVIKDAMIDTVNASKINAGQINTNFVNLLSANGNLVIKDNTIQIKDGTRTRVQIGLDGNSDYSINVWDKNGNLMFDSNGITDKAIKSKIIRDDMVSDTANISGGKLNIGSVIESINNDNTKTLKSSKINVDSENQTLDVIFNTLRTNIDNKESRNLLLNSKSISKDIVTTSELGNQVGSIIYKNIKVEPNKTYTFSYNKLEEGYPFLTIVTQSSETTATTHNGIYIDSARIRQLNTTSNKLVFTTSENEKYISITTGNFIGITITKISYSKLKLEVGENKNPIWSSAPEDIEEKIQSNTTALNIEQGRINTLISETDITKGQVNTLNNNYSNLNQTVSGISTTVGSHTTSIANVNTLANSKAKTFVATPTTPYQIGDLWVQGTSGDLMRCKVARATGNYVASDWEKASKYTDDTKANSVEGVLNSTITRVASAESSISQLSDSIALKVESSEVTTIANNAISNLEIGGRNLARNTKTFAKGDRGAGYWTHEDGYTFSVDEEGYTVATGKRENLTDISIRSLHSNRVKGIKKGETYTFSIWIKVDNVDAWDVKTPLIFEVYDTQGVRIQYQDVGIALANTNKPTIRNGEWFLFTSTHTITVDNPYSMATRLTIFKNGTISFKKLKIEKGNKATDWTPAPEDVDNAVSTVDGKVNTANTNISNLTTRVSSAEQKITSNAIISTVSSTITNAVNNIQIGGRNLLTMKNIDGYEMDSFTKRRYTVTAQINQQYAGIELLNLRDVMELNKEYIFQCRVRKTSGTLTNILIYQDTQFNIHEVLVDGIIRDIWDSSDMGINNSSWHTITILFSRVVDVVGDGKGDVNALLIQPNRSLTTPVGVEVKDFKLEKGNKATDWTSAPEDFEVGGVNLLRNSEYKDFTHWTSPTAEGYSEIESEEFYNIMIVGREGYTGTTRSQTQQFLNGLLEANQTYTLSGYVYVDNSVPFDAPSTHKNDIHIRYYDSANNIVDVGNYDFGTVAKNTWIRFTNTFTIGSDINTSKVMLIKNIGKNGRVIFSRLKLEKGEVATDWAKNPYDVDSAISTVDERVTTTSNKVSTIETSLSGITSRVSSVETKTNTNASNLSSLTNRVSSAEQKITDSAITSKVSEVITNTVKIGGRNLVRNADMKTAWSLWNSSRGTSTLLSTGTKLVTTDLNQTAIISPLAINVVTGIEHTLTFKARGNIARFEAYILATASPNYRPYIAEPSSKVINTTTFTEISVTFTIPTDLNTNPFNRVFFGGSATTVGQWIEIAKNSVKLEVGTIKTDFTLAQEDIEDSISSIDTRMSSAETKLTANSLTTTISTALAGGNAISNTKFTMNKDGLTIKNGGLKIQNSSSVDVLTANTDGVLFAKDGAIVVANSQSDAWNNQGYRTKLIKEGLQFNYDSTQNGITPSSSYIKHEYSKGGLELGGVHTIRGTGKGGVTIDDVLYINGNNSIYGNMAINGKITINSNWLYTTGDTGWYNGTWGGGWYMSDSTWIRSYNSKDVYINKMLRADGGLQVGASGGGINATSAGGLYSNTSYTNRLKGRSSGDQIALGDTGGCRIDTAGGNLRLYVTAIGASDNGIYVQTNGQVAFKVDGVNKHIFNASGTKTGGTMEIEGVTYGMSPTDSPQTLIEYIVPDLKVEGELRYELDSIYRQMIEYYVVIGSNPNVIIKEKGYDYIILEGTGLVDLVIKGQRKYAEKDFRIMGGFEHNGNEEKFGY